MAEHFENGVLKASTLNYNSVISVTRITLISGCLMCVVGLLFGAVLFSLRR